MAVFMHPSVRKSAGFCLAALLASALSTGAAATTTLQRHITAQWIVTWAGLPVFEANIHADIQNGRYAASFRARTRGLLDLTSRMRTQIRTEGRVAGTLLKPERVRQRYRLKRGGHRRVLMAWQGDGAVQTRIVPPESPGKRKPVPLAMRRATEDPITATLNGLMAPRSGPPCVYAARVFEGRRRADFRLSFVGQAKTPRLAVGTLPKTAAVCLLHAKRLAGFHDRHMRQVPKIKPARVWIVHLKQYNLWLPVQLEFQTRYGMARARLASLKLR